MAIRTACCWLLVFTWLVSSGCGEPPARRASEEPATPLSDVSDAGFFNEWQRVYTSEVTGTRLKRTLRGYLCHRFTLENRKGTHFVYDASRNKVGFVLPGGKAYVFEEDLYGKTVSREIAYKGLKSGVRDLLGLTGNIEFEEVSAADIPKERAKPITGH